MASAVIPDVERTSGVRSPAREDGRRIWLVLVDPLPARVFCDCGIVDGLREALGEGLALVLVVHPKHVRAWSSRLEGIEVLEGEQLVPLEVPPVERALRRVDFALDRRIGFFPLAIRHSLRHGFHPDRWIPGHSNSFLDPDRAGPLPRWEALDPVMMRWHFSTRRHVPAVLLERMRAECAGLVVTNLQGQAAVPYLVAARRLGLPVVGYVASWDHTVGKGVVSPHLERYVVQNETMRDDLRRYHGVDPERVVVTGWPQTDVYHRRRPRAEYEALLEGLGLDPSRPVVLFAGNTPTNAPYEGKLVERLVSWWRESGAQERFSLLFRPHPRDHLVADRYGAAAGLEGAAMQKPSFTDLHDLATLLQHVDCLVSTAGTILLDALVNDRASVCVMFDEGAPEGEHWAGLNLVGEHYRELAESDAFSRAHDFEQLVACVERALEHPEELAAERVRVTRRVVGEVDGRAAQRVVRAILETFERSAVPAGR